MADGQVVIEITADNRQAVQAAQETSGSITNAFGGMLKKVSFAAAAATVGKTILEWGKAAVEAASDLQEVQNVVDVTFGSSASEIDSWAKNARTQFGLTETQAKKFASTIGATMKSSGLSGDEIVGMSEDLAGLAADMASFYNMDFETAFQKIRSGISGETEPLKQLGINMSVANLEAYALTQGITKAFDQMSQAEQTQLRYQYLMQATADAQGDFARTTDGYANSMRTLETALDTVKTKLGKPFLDVVAGATNVVSEFINQLFPEEKPNTKTVFDDFDGIDQETRAKLAETESAYRTVIAALDELDQLQSTGLLSSTTNGINDKVNVLDTTTRENWEKFAEALGKVGLLKGADVARVKELAGALTGEDITTTKAQAWQTMLDAMGNNAETIGKMRGTNAEEAADWLGRIATSANTLDAADTKGWDELFKVFIEGLPGLENTEEGKAFFEAIKGNADKAADGANAVTSSTDKMGDAASAAAAKQSELLKIIKDQSKYFPGLNDLIDANTGEIKGGTQAVREYMKAWKEARDNDINLQGLRRKNTALEESKQEIKDLSANYRYTPANMEAQGIISIMPGETYKEQEDAYTKTIAAAQKYGRYAAQKGLNRYDAELMMKRLLLYGKMVDGSSPFSDEDMIYGRRAFTNIDHPEVGQEFHDAALAAYDLAVKTDAVEKATKSFEKEVAAAGFTMDDVTGVAEEAAEAEIQNAEALKEEIRSLTEAADDAAQAVMDYYNQVRQSVAQTVSGVISGFSEATTQADSELAELKKKEEKINKELKDIRDQKTKNQKRTELTEVQAKIKVIEDNGNTRTSAQQMINNLQSQLNYMNEYQTLLDSARGRKVSDEVLAQLSDGSTESMEYLRALANASDEEIADINRMYSAVGQNKETFTDKLTEQKLAADETWDGLVDSAAAAISKLQQAQPDAFDASKDLITNIVSGLKAKQPELDKEITTLAFKLAQLGSLGVGFVPGATVGFGGRWIPRYLPKHKDGLNYVPYDGYTAQLHAGETVLTREEARIWRGYMDSRNSYGLSGAIWNSAPNMGGDVYLDGQIVGNLISARQGRDFRRMERSGWRG
jgi:hypothetical protein